MFDERQHPRHPAGTDKGGEFAPKSAQASAPAKPMNRNPLKRDWQTPPSIHKSVQTPAGGFYVFKRSYLEPLALDPNEMRGVHEAKVFKGNDLIQTFDGDNPNDAIRQAEEYLSEILPQAQKHGQVVDSGEMHGYSYKITHNWNGSLDYTEFDPTGKVIHSESGVDESDIPTLRAAFAADFQDDEETPEPEEPADEPEDDEPQQDEPDEEAESTGEVGEVVAEDSVNGYRYTFVRNANGLYDYTEYKPDGSVWFETEDMEESDLPLLHQSFHDDYGTPQEESETYSIAKETIDRYLMDHGIQPDRYGIGGAAMKAIMGLMAMHIMSGLADGPKDSPKQSAAQPQGPSNLPFEQLHPRQQTMSGKYKPGQFAPKNQGQSPAASAPAATPPQPKPVRPLTERPDKVTPTQAPMAPPRPQVQPPSDAQTAQIAAKWGWNQPERNYPDNLNKPPEQQELYQPREATLQNLTDEVYNAYVKTAGNPQRKKFLADGTPNPDYVGGNVYPKSAPEKTLLDTTHAGEGDIFNNPAAKARAEKAELDRLTAFDPASFATPEQPDAPQKVGDVSSFDGDFVAMNEARKQRERQLQANRDWMADTVNNPDSNIGDVATEHEYDHEPFSQYIKELEAHEQQQWKRRETFKTAIRKTWGVHGGDLARMENKGRDHSTLMGSDELRGNIPESDLYEFLGPDESSWPQAAWEMLRENPVPKPGAHDIEWVRSHAGRFGAYSAPQEFADYPEPEDGMPFSKARLVEWVDRYFQAEQTRTRKRQMNGSFWTALDSYL